MSRRHPPVPAELARRGIDCLAATPSPSVAVPGAGQALFSLLKPALMRRYLLAPAAAPTTKDKAHA